MEVLGPLFTLGVLCTKALGAAVDIDCDKCDIFVPEWEVEVTPGGEKVTLNGTVQEIHRELLSRNPNWNSDFDFDRKLKLKALDPTESAALVKRTDWGGSHYFCGGRWGYGNYGAIREGIAYLAGVKGRPTNRAGPGACGRVSCSYGAAIYWCNDDPKPKMLGSYWSIGSGADYVGQKCWRPDWSGSLAVAACQVFHKTKWNVIIRKDNG